MHTSPSNKVYIGITSMNPPEERYANGRGYGPKTVFGKAISKYGWDNFSHTVLMSGLTENEAKQEEIRLIAEYKSTNRKHGYNMSAGGDGTKGVVPSEETRRKLSIASSGKNNPFYGRKHSLESRRKISENHADLSGKNHPNYGKRLPDKVRRNMSKNHADVSGSNNPNWGKGKPVAQIEPETQKVIKTFVNANRASKETGVNRNCIAWCCTGKYQRAGGYIWKYTQPN